MAKRLGPMGSVLARKGASVVHRDGWGSMLLFKVLHKLTPAMPCGMYSALPEAGCGVMGMTVVGGSGVCTIVGATSLECNLVVTHLRWYLDGINPLRAPRSK
jgi:hypothetical protein